MVDRQGLIFQILQSVQEQEEEAGQNFQKVKPQVS